MTTFYAHVNPSTMMIELISPVLTAVSPGGETYIIVELSQSLGEAFILGTENPNNYFVFLENDKFILLNRSELKTSILARTSNLPLAELLDTGEHAEVSIDINLAAQQITMTINPNRNKALIFEILALAKTEKFPKDMKFYITHKHDPQSLITYFEVDLSQLNSELLMMTAPLTDRAKETLVIFGNQVSIYTKRIFDSYHLTIE